MLNGYGEAVASKFNHERGGTRSYQKIKIYYLTIIATKCNFFFKQDSIVPTRTNKNFKNSKRKCQSIPKYVSTNNLIFFNNNVYFECFRRTYSNFDILFHSFFIYLDVRIFKNLRNSGGQTLCLPPECTNLSQTFIPRLC